MKKFLEAIALADVNGNLSLTNVGIYIAYFLIIYSFVGGMSMEMLATILGLLGNYISKRVVNNKSVAHIEPSVDDSKSDEIAAIKRELEALSSSIAFMKNRK